MHHLIRFRDQDKMQKAFQRDLQDNLFSPALIIAFAAAVEATFFMPHEVDERIVQIKNDCLYHDRPNFFTSCVTHS